MKTINVGNEGFQTLEIPFENNTINMTIKFLQTRSEWVMDLTYLNKTINGVRLSVGAILLKNNLPFDFLIEDNSKQGFDPYDAEDFTQNRCTFFLLERVDLVQIRGFDVQ